MSLFFCIFILFLRFNKIHSEALSYRLSASPPGLEIWSTPPTNKIFLDTPVYDSRTKSRIKVYLAQNEVEPFLFIMKSTSSQDVTVVLPTFSNPLITFEMYEVQFIQLTQLSSTQAFGEAGKYYPDPLVPIDSGDTVSLAANENKILWINVKVPYNGVDVGDYTEDIVIDGSVNIELRVHVFDFKLPKESHIKGSLKYRNQMILDKYGVTPGVYDYDWKYTINMTRKFMLERKQTPEESMWPSAVNQGAVPLAYNCDGDFVYESDPDNYWSFGRNAREILIEGINGMTFPSYVIYFGGSVDKQGRLDPRPDEFCGVTRQDTDWKTDEKTEYNDYWFKYMKSLQDYFEGFGLLDKMYLQLADEPSSEGDFEGLSWYTQEIFAAAPKLRTYITMYPTKEVWENTNTGTKGKVHVWCNELLDVDPELLFQRNKYCGEENWVYFLRGDIRTQPMFTPIAIDHQGFDSKIVGWWLWRYRLTGITYYTYVGWDYNPWTEPREPFDVMNGENSLLFPPDTGNAPILYGSTDHRIVSSIRSELLRDGLEDYEYLYILNGNEHPDFDNQHGVADLQVKKMVTGLEGYNKNEDFFYSLRKEIGYYLSGETPIENLDISIPAHSRGTGLPKDAYINFQDPGGFPTENPLIYDGKTWLKMGWTKWNVTKGYGWIGDFSDVLSYAGGSGVSPLLRSMVYCNNGFQKVFLWVLANGGYTVKIGAGFPGYNHRHNFIRIQGVTFIDDEFIGDVASDPNGGYFERERDIYVTNNILILEMGIQGEFTTICYLRIEANGKEKHNNDDTILAEPPSDYNTDTCGGGGESSNVAVYVAVAVSLSVFFCSCVGLIIVVVLILSCVILIPVVAWGIVKVAKTSKEKEKKEKREKIEETEMV